MEEKRSAAEEELIPLASQPTLFLKVNLFNSGQKKKERYVFIFIPKNKVTRNHKITIKFIKMYILMYYLNYFQTILLNNLYISPNIT